MKLNSESTKGISARDKSLDILKKYGAYDPNTDIVIQNGKQNFSIQDKNLSSKPRIYDDVILQQKHESKLRKAELTRTTILDKIKYLSEVTTGKAFDSNSIQLISRPDSDPFIIIGDRKVSTADYLKELEAKKPRPRSCIRNLTLIKNSHLEASIEYFNHEWRVGQATKQFFDERTLILKDRAEQIKSYDQQAKITGSKLISLKQGYLELTTIPKKASTYLSAITKAATSITFIDANPIYHALEKLVGKVWTTKISNNLSARDLAAKIEQKVVTDYITKKSVSSGAITAEMVREAAIDGAAWGFRMSFIPQIVSMIGGMANFNVSPKAIYDLFRSSKMLAPNLGAIEKLTAIENKTTSRKQKIAAVLDYITPSYVKENIEAIKAHPSWKSKISGALALVVIPVLEKVIPSSSPINPILLFDTMLMKFVGKTLKYSHESGLELTTNGDMLRTVEAALTTSFAIDAGLRLGQTFESYKETGKLNYLQDLKTEEELLELIKSNPEIFSEQDTGLFGRILSLEEELITQVNNPSEEDTKSTINHISIGHTIYTTEVSEQGNLTLIKQDDSGTYVYQNEKFELIPEEDSLVPIYTSPTPSQEFNEDNSDEKQVDNVLNEISEEISPLDKEGVLQIISKHFDIDNESIGIIDIDNNNDTNILINEDTPFRDESIPKLKTILYALQSDSNIDRNLIIKSLSEEGTQSYLELLSTLRSNTTSQKESMLDIPSLDPNSSDFGLTNINDCIEVIQLLMSDKISETDRDKILNALNNDNSSTIEDNEVNDHQISFGNFNIINKDGKTFVVISSTELSQDLKNDLTSHIFSQFNPSFSQIIEMQRLIPAILVSDIDRIQADLRAKILDENPEITDISQVNLKRNGTFVSNATLVDGRQTIITANTSGNILTSIPLGQVETDVNIADYSQYIKNHSNLENINQFGYQTSINVSLSSTPILHTPNDSNITRAIDIQNEADIPYDYLIFTDSQDQITIAYVNSQNRYQSAIDHQINIGLVPDIDGTLNKEAAQKGLSIIKDILDSSGTLEVSSIDSKNEMISEMIEDNPELLIAKSETSYSQTEGTLTIKDVNNRSDKAIELAYNNSLIFAKNYNEYLGDTTDFISLEAFKNIVLQEEKEYSLLEMAKILGLHPRMVNGVNYNNIIYIPDGAQPNLTQIAIQLDLDPSQTILQPTNDDPTLYLVGQNIPGIESRPSYEFPIDHLVYQEQIKNQDGSFSYSLTTTPSEDSVIVSYIPVEKPIEQKSLTFWKESFVNSKYLGDIVVSLSDGPTDSKAKIYVDPISLNTYAVVKNENTEFLLPVINAKFTYDDLEFFNENISDTTNQQDSNSNLTEIIENQIANQIMTWSDPDKHYYKREDSTILSLTSYENQNPTEGYQILKNSENQVLVTQDGKLLFNNIFDNSLSYYDKDENSFIQISHPQVQSLGEYLYTFKSVTGDNNIPLQLNGMPLFCKDEILYVLSGEGIQPIGNIYQKDKLNATQDLSLLSYYEMLGIQDSQQLLDDRSYANLSSTTEKLIHSATTNLPEHFIETSKSITDISTNSKYELYDSANYVHEESGQIIFTDDTESLYIATSQGFKSVPRSEIILVDNWLDDKQLIQMQLHDRQTRLNVVVDPTGDAFILTANGLQSLGNYNSLIRLGLIGYERPNNHQFYTDMPDQVGELILDKRFSIEEKIGKFLDPSFALLTDIVLEKLHHANKLDIDINYLKTLYPSTKYITFDEIPPKYLQAVLSSEDELLLSHDSDEGIGVDTRGILRAIVSLVLDETAIGGSTIPMQVARNSLWSVDQRTSISMDRKISEWILANNLVKEYTPENLLEKYINLINYGVSEGVGYSSEIIFNKEMQDLSLAETAMLAVLPKNPNGQGYWSQPAADLWADNASAVLRRMEENGFINQNEMINAQTEVYQKTHIDTSSSDLVFIKNQFKNNQINIDKIDELALEFNKISFADRFKSATSESNYQFSNGLTSEGMLLPDSTFTSSTTSYIYQDFISYLVSQNIIDSTLGDNIREQFYQNATSTKTPLNASASSQTNITPGPQYQIEYIDSEGNTVHQNYWKYTSETSIKILPDISTISTQQTDNNGNPIIFDVLRKSNSNSDFTPILDSLGHPLVRDHLGNIWAVGEDGLVKQSSSVAFIEHSQDKIEIFDANTKSNFLVVSPELNLDKTELVKDISDRYYEKLDNGDLRVIGDAIQLRDGSLFLTKNNYLTYDLEKSKYSNDELIISLKNALLTLNIDKSILDIYNSFNKNTENPYTGYMGDLNSNIGLAASPRASSEALDNLGIESNPYELVNNQASLDIFERLVAYSQSSNKPMIAWINTSLDTHITKIDSDHGNSIYAEVNPSEKQVIIQSIENINGKEYVVYLDPKTLKLQATELEIFGAYLAPNSTSPIKLLLLGQDDSPVNISENSIFKYDSDVVQVALHLNNAEYVYGTNNDVDKLMSINPKLQQLVLESAKDIVLNSGSNGFQAIFMDDNGNILSAAGLDKNGNVLPIQTILNSSFIAGSVMKPITAQILISEGLDPYKTYRVSTPYHEELSFNLPSALRVSNTEVFYLPTSNLTDGEFENGLIKLGFGSPIDNPFLPNGSGFVGTNEWAMNNFGRQLTSEEIARKAIGYGDLEVTLLQLIHAYYGLSNSGTNITPSLVHQDNPILGEPLFTDTHGLDQIIQGLHEVTTNEKGTAFQSFGKLGNFDVYGKTGTAITNGEPNSLFSGYYVDPTTNHKIYFSVIFPQSGSGHIVASPFVGKIISNCQIDDELCIPNDGKFENFLVDLEEEYSPPGWDNLNSDQKDLIDFTKILKNFVDTYRNDISASNPIDPDIFVNQLSATINNTEYGKSIMNDPEYLWLLSNIRVSLLSNDLDQNTIGIPNVLYLRLLSLTNLPGSPAKLNNARETEEVYNDLNWYLEQGGKNKYSAEVISSNSATELFPGDTVWTKNRDIGYGALILDKYEHNGIYYYYISNSDTNVWAYDTKHDGRIRDRWVTYEELIFQFRSTNNSLFVIRPND